MRKEAAAADQRLATAAKQFDASETSYTEAKTKADKAKHEARKAQGRHARARNAKKNHELAEKVLAGVKQQVADAKNNLARWTDQPGK